jgi:hypothetical protein
VSFLLILFILGAINAYFAKIRGRDPVAWFVIGMLFGVLGILAVFLLPALNKNENGETAGTPKELDPTPSKFSHKDWFFLDDNHTQQGPYSWDGLNAAWRENRFNSTSYIWCEGMPEWKKVEDVDGLLDELQTITIE